MDSSFLDVTPKAQATKKKLVNWPHRNYKLLCFKEYHQENKNTTHEIRKTLADHLSDKELISRIHKVHL